MFSLQFPPHAQTYSEPRFCLMCLIRMVIWVSTSPTVRDFVEAEFGTFSKLTFYKMESGEKHLNNHPVTIYGPYNLVPYVFFVFAIHMNLTITTLKSHFLVVNNFDLQIIFFEKTCYSIMLILKYVFS